MSSVRQLALAQSRTRRREASGSGCYRDVLNVRASVTPRNFACGFWRRRLLLVGIKFGSEAKLLVSGCKCSSGKASRTCPVACAGDDVGCVVGETRAGSMIGGVVIVTDERLDVG